MKILQVHPRLRGGLSYHDRTRWYSSGSSPLTRGFASFNRITRRSGGFIPAYAGVWGQAPRAVPQRRVHPRLRGGLLTDYPYIDSWRGSSPLTRGFECSAAGRKRDRGFIPAYAGVCQG